jgi:hypothetical protein
LAVPPYPYSGKVGFIGFDGLFPRISAMLQRQKMPKNHVLAAVQPHPFLMGLLMGTITKRPEGRMFIDYLAEQAKIEMPATN